MVQKALLIAGTLIAVLSGCKSTAPIQQSESFSFPAVGSVATRGVGDSLIRQDTGLLIPEIDIQNDTTIGSHMLSKGHYGYYDANATGIWFISKNEKEYFYLRKADDQICIDKTKECGAAKYVLNKKISSLSTNAFQQTLLYNGKIGNRITLGYREFTSNLARTAFSNNVDYDLSESTTIGYKGARLEILKATNTEISYRVLSGFAD
jgi:hypothetical protein